MIIKLIFQKGPSLRTRLLTAVVVSVALIAVGKRSQHLDPLRSVLSVIVYPIQFSVGFPINLAHQAVESISSYSHLLRDNQRLKAERLIDKMRLLKFSALEKENIRLRALLEKSFQLGEQVLVAELLSVNLDPYEQIVLVNKGTRFGVFKGQPVLDANGIVGQVLRANPFNAEIMLITDPNHALPVQVNRNGLRSIAVGSGQTNRLNLPFLPNNADIKEGDLLITSGLGGVFPQGYPVGIVTDVMPQPDKPFSKISAQLTAHLDRSRELLLVWSHSNPIPLMSEQNDSVAKTNHGIYE